jgi:Uma2 family endonuclease
MSNYFTPAMAIPPSKRGQPAWGLAMLFPAQGFWSEEEYLALDTNHIVELVNGHLEVHPMASLAHQMILKFLFRWFDDFVTAHKLGLVLFAPFPVRIVPGTLREPDVVFLKPGRLEKGNPRAVSGADLALEVISEGAANRKRDLRTKRREYALARIPEYWLVDPELQKITVLKLAGKRYREHGVFGIGDVATSRLLPGLTLSVQDAFAAGNAVV